MRVPSIRSAILLALIACLTLGVIAGIALGAESPKEVRTASSADRIERQLQGDGGGITDLVPAPKVTASSWLVFDDTSNEPIAAKDPGTPRPIASLAKLMTALVVVDRIQLDEVVTIPPSVNQLPADASVMGARAGEKWLASELLKAMLGHSANDAAIALATHVGDGKVATFVDYMNARAADLDLADSSFASPTG
ncbi:MAG: D-alanyl-D-alanine carboxypeptidase DacC 1, partial [Thermoleophilia bacterium]|nr:D-alanyl-D-alanine carboxypeptidase DacC 1 [Thermoleophilia bacterium]